MKSKGIIDLVPIVISGLALFGNGLIAFVRGHLIGGVVCIIIGVATIFFAVWLAHSTEHPR